MTQTDGLDALANALEQDANAHLQGAFDEIGERYDELESRLLKPAGIPQADVLEVGFYFWDCWTDARNHDWYNYRDAKRDDWPVYARAVAEAIRRGNIPTTVPDSLLRPPPTIRQRFRAWRDRRA